MKIIYNKDFIPIIFETLKDFYAVDESILFIASAKGHKNLAAFRMMFCLIYKDHTREPATNIMKILGFKSTATSSRYYDAAHKELKINESFKNAYKTVCRLLNEKYGQNGSNPKLP